MGWLSNFKIAVRQPSTWVAVSATVAAVPAVGFLAPFVALGAFAFTKGIPQPDLDAYRQQLKGRDFAEAARLEQIARLERLGEKDAGP